MSYQQKIDIIINNLNKVNDLTNAYREADAAAASLRSEIEAIDKSIGENASEIQHLGRSISVLGKLRNFIKPIAEAGGKAGSLTKSQTRKEYLLREARLNEAMQERAARIGINRQKVYAKQERAILLQNTAARKQYAKDDADMMRSESSRLAQQIRLEARRREIVNRFRGRSQEFNRKGGGKRLEAEDLANAKEVQKAWEKALKIPTETNAQRRQAISLLDSLSQELEQYNRLQNESIRLERARQTIGKRARSFNDRIATLEEAGRIKKPTADSYRADVRRAGIEVNTRGNSEQANIILGELDKKLAEAEKRAKEIKTKNNLGINKQRAFNTIDKLQIRVDNLRMAGADKGLLDGLQKSITGLSKAADNGAIDSYTLKLEKARGAIASLEQAERHRLDALKKEQTQSKLLSSAERKILSGKAINNKELEAWMSGGRTAKALPPAAGFPVDQPLPREAMLPFGGARMIGTSREFITNAQGRRTNIPALDAAGLAMTLPLEPKRRRGGRNAVDPNAADILSKTDPNFAFGSENIFKIFGKQLGAIAPAVAGSGKSYQRELRNRSNFTNDIFQAGLKTSGLTRGNLIPKVIAKSLRADLIEIATAARDGLVPIQEAKDRLKAYNTQISRFQKPSGGREFNVIGGVNRLGTKFSRLVDSSAVPDGLIEPIRRSLIGLAKAAKDGAEPINDLRDRLDALGNRINAFSAPRKDTTLSGVLQRIQNGSKANLEFSGGLSPAQSIDRIVRTVNKATTGKEVAGIGQNVVSSFVDKISSGASVIKDSGKQFGSNFITSLMKRLGMASPSKVMIYIAKNLADSFINELLRQYPYVRATIDKTFSVDQSFYPVKPAVGYGGNLSAGAFAGGNSIFDFGIGARGKFPVLPARALPALPSAGMTSSDPWMGPLPNNQNLTARVNQAIEQFAQQRLLPPATSAYKPPLPPPIPAALFSTKPPLPPPIPASLMGGGGAGNNGGNRSTSNNNNQPPIQPPGNQRLLGVGDLVNPRLMSLNNIDEAIQGFTLLRAGIDATDANFQQLDNALKGVIGRLEREKERRDPNADFLTSRLGPRTGRAVSEGLVGAAFPLLFGGGIGGSLGGGLGGLIGGFSGGMLGLGGSLLLSSLGSQVDAFVQASIDTGKALDDVVGNFDKLKESSIISSKDQEKLIGKLIESGQVATAYALIQEDLNRTIGYSGMKSLAEAATASDRFNRAMAELGKQIEVFVAGPLATFLNAVANGINRQNKENTVQRLLTTLPAGRRKNLQSDLRAAVPGDTANSLNGMPINPAFGFLFGVNRNKAGDIAGSADRGLIPEKVLDNIITKYLSSDVKPKPKPEQIAQENISNLSAVATANGETVNILTTIRDFQRRVQEQAIKDRREQEDLDRQAADIRKDYERQIGDIRLSIADKVSQMEQANKQKEIDMVVAQGSIREAQLKNSFDIAKQGLQSDDLANRLLDAVGAYFSAQMSAENQLEQRRMQFQLEMSNQQIEVEKYKLEVSRNVARLNIDTAKKVDDINFSVARRNQDAAINRVQLEVDIAKLQIDGARSQILLSKAKADEEVRRLSAMQSPPASSLNEYGIAALKANKQTAAAAAAALEELKKNEEKFKALTTTGTEIRPISAPRRQSVDFSGVDNALKRASTLQARLKELTDQLEELFKQNRIIELVSTLNNIAFSDILSGFADLNITINDAKMAMGDFSPAIDKINKSYDTTIQTIQSLQGVNEAAKNGVIQIINELKAQQTEYAKLLPTIKAYNEAINGNTSRIQDLRGSINELLGPITALDQAMALIERSGGIEKNGESAQNLIKTAKEVDRLTQKLKVLQGIKEIANAWTESFVNFNKEFMKTGDLMKAFDNWIQEVGSKAVDLLFKFTLEPMQEKVFKDLAQWLGFGPEQDPTLAPLQSIDATTKEILKLQGQMQERAKALQPVPVSQPQAPAQAAIPPQTGSIYGRYLQGMTGGGSTGPHFDIKRADGAYFERNAIDKYVEVDGRPISSGLTELGGTFYAPRKKRPYHGGWDYAFSNGATMGLRNGAKWIKVEKGTDVGDIAAFMTPDGSVYKVIHGKFQSAQPPAAQQAAVSTTSAPQQVSPPPQPAPAPIPSPEPAPLPGFAAPPLANSPGSPGNPIQLAVEPHFVNVQSQWDLANLDIGVNNAANADAMGFPVSGDLFNIADIQSASSSMIMEIFNINSELNKSVDGLATYNQSIVSMMSSWDNTEVIKSIGDERVRVESDNVEKLKSIGEKMGMGLQILGGIMMGIAGFQQMKKGGAYNILSGLAGVFGAVSQVSYGYGKLFGIKGFAEGGRPPTGQPSWVGENGPELWWPDRAGTIVPLDQLYVPGKPLPMSNDSGNQSDNADYGSQDPKSIFHATRASLDQQRAAMSSSESSTESMQPQSIDVRSESTVINNVEYVTMEQHRKGMQDAARMGQALAYQGMRNSAPTRRRLAL